MTNPKIHVCRRWCPAHHPEASDTQPPVNREADRRHPLLVAASAHARGRRWLIAAMVLGVAYLIVLGALFFTGYSDTALLVVGFFAGSPAWPVSRAWHWFGYARGVDAGRRYAQPIPSMYETARKLVSDLDRCEHGRHRIDSCLDCPGGESTGNLYVPPGTRIGTRLYGNPIVMPADRVSRLDEDAWKAVGG